MTRLETCSRCGGRFSTESETEVRCEECEYEHPLRQEFEETSVWVRRALGAFVACQFNGIIPPEFPGGLAGFLLNSMKGWNKDLKTSCKKFVDDTVPLIEMARQQKPSQKVGI